MLENDQKPPLDRVEEIKAKYSFMSIVIPAIMGSRNSYGEDVAFGCQLFMRSIRKELEELQKSLEKIEIEVPKEV